MALIAALFWAALPAWGSADAPPVPAAAKHEYTLTPAQLEEIRLIEIAKAAQLYTQIAFSKENLRKMHQNLPLNADEAKRLTTQLSTRFQACMEGEFEARLANAYDAQVLRKTMQHALDPALPEPKDSRTVLPVFRASNAYCASRVKAWTAAQIQ